MNEERWEEGTRPAEADRSGGRGGYHLDCIEELFCFRRRNPQGRNNPFEGLVILDPLTPNSTTRWLLRWHEVG